MSRLRCTVTILVIAFVTDGELKLSAKGWYSVSPESYPDVLQAFKRAFYRPVVHRTFNQVTPLKINIAAVKLGVHPRMYGASVQVDFEHSAENPSCENFIAAVQIGNNTRDKPIIENWSCYYEDERAFNFKKMIKNLNIMVPDR